MKFGIKKLNISPVYCLVQNVFLYLKRQRALRRALKAGYGNRNITIDKVKYYLLVLFRFFAAVLLLGLCGELVDVSLFG